jgi:1-deoxy-D-xylulose-5-phosphate synthase
VARADDSICAALDSFSSRIGLAFQIADDLVDHSGDETKLGKQARKDERQKGTLMGSLLAQLQSPSQLRDLNLQQLEQLAGEIRAELRGIVQIRSAHFASNLGVVELCIALHRAFDFSHDRIIWDTGHQIYPHKLITGRYAQIHTIRTKGGLMGYPNPAESPYDQFVTGHAGCSVSCAMGLRVADTLLGRSDRHSVAVIGDGALPSGIVFEALNNAGGHETDLLVVLNDNKMAICPPVGGLARYLDRVSPSDPYELLRLEIEQVLRPAAPGPERRQTTQRQIQGLVEASRHGGMLFEELGWRYFGPVNGHDLPLLVGLFERIRSERGPILLHVLTEKGHGFAPAMEDPVKYHAPAPFVWDGNQAVPAGHASGKGYTNVMSEAIFAAMRRDPKVVVLTAAMCEGNKLQRVRTEMPDRFFDTGITESHAVAFAAGLAKNGIRPVVAIYSTFLQRAYDQLFQEVALQNLPVTFCLDRAGLTGTDGPTHHGVFDTTYIRSLPNFVVMAPGDELDVSLMLDFALERAQPMSIRYPKANTTRVARVPAPITLGKAELIRWGVDGMLIVFGSLLDCCMKAAARLCAEGIDVGVINARFAKPIDSDTILLALEQCSFVVTVEEGSLVGGFGAAVLEVANAAAADTRHLLRLGLPDQFVEHAERDELLSDLGLDAAGIYRRARDWAARRGMSPRINQHSDAYIPHDDNQPIAAAWQVNQ